MELAPGARLGEASADRGDYLLVLADYEATIVAGAPSVPQPDASVTQYVEWRYAADPAVLAEAAAGARSAPRSSSKNWREQQEAA